MKKNDLPGLGLFNSNMNLCSDLNGYLVQFCSEKNLKILVLVNKEFSSLSVSEVKGRAFRNLDVSCNQLTELPTHYPKEHLCEGEKIDYSKIEYLECSFNKLTSLPDCLGNCKFLECSGNELTSLPDCLRNCEELDCHNNQLTSLPDCLGNCERLYCSFNQLTSLPDCLGKCKTLYCSWNKLTSLPECLENCEKLLCCDNQLTSLPDCLRKCKTVLCQRNQFPDCLKNQHIHHGGS